MIQVEFQTEKISEDLREQAQRGFDDLMQRADLGFHQLASRYDLWQRSAEVGRNLRSRFRHLGVLGIGGSSLGVRALIQALDPGDWQDKISVFDNVDPVHFNRRLNQLADVLSECHWVIISKSGNTIETLCAADFILQLLREKGIDPSGHFTVVTEEKSSPLWDWAQQNGHPVLPVPIDVGGRFSVLTPVGLLPAAFLGLDIEAMRQGAEWARAQADLTVELVAQSLKNFALEKWITLFWSYTDLLHTSCFWYQQLWSESLGKALDRRGQPAPRASSPFACLGASDQHSILQQVMEGARDKFVWFFRCRAVEKAGDRLEKTAFARQELLVGRGMGELLAAEADATREAFTQQKIPSLTLVVEQLSERELAALFMLLELVVGAVGEAMNINAFDQPGVELGKRLARAKLASQ